MNYTADKKPNLSSKWYNLCLFFFSWQFSLASTYVSRGANVIELKCPPSLPGYMPAVQAQWRSYLSFRWARELWMFPWKLILYPVFQHETWGSRFIEIHLKFFFYDHWIIKQSFSLLLTGTVGWYWSLFMVDFDSVVNLWIKVVLSWIQRIVK